MSVSRGVRANQPNGFWLLPSVTPCPIHFLNGFVFAGPAALNSKVMETKTPITPTQKQNLETWIQAVISSRERDIDLIIKTTAAQVWGDFNDEKATKILAGLSKSKIVRRIQQPRF